MVGLPVLPSYLPPLIPGDSVPLPPVGDEGEDVPSGRSTRGSHQISDAQICERRWWLKYFLMYVALKEKPYRLRGTLIHWCLAYHYASKMGQAPDWFYKRDLATTLEKAGRGHPDDVRTAKELLSAYQREYPTEPWEPFAIEQEFSATVGELDPGGPDSSLDSEVVTCRPDLLVLGRDETQQPVLDVFDYKTSGKNWEFVDGRWMMRGGLEKWKEDGPYVLHWQVLVNLLILRARSNAARLGHIPVRGFWIQRLTREPDKYKRFYFDRHLLSVPVGPYNEAPRVIRAAVAKERSIRENAAKGIKPAAALWACDGKFGPCDFRDVCIGRDSEDRQKILDEHYTRDV